MHGGLQIHVEYDMLITRHRDPKSHANYNQFQKYALIGQYKRLFLVNQKMANHSDIMKPWIWK
jgi:hypothetical protein